MRCSARRHLLAGAGFAQQQHGGRRRRNALEPLAHQAHRLGLANQPFQPALGGDFAAQHVVFLLQARALKAAFDRIQQLRQRKRLEQEIRRARAQGVDGGVQIGVGGHQHHIAGKALAAQLVQPLRAATPAGQGDIQNDQVVMLALQ